MGKKGSNGKPNNNGKGNHPGKNGKNGKGNQPRRTRLQKTAQRDVQVAAQPGLDQIQQLIDQANLDYQNESLGIGSVYGGLNEELSPLYGQYQQQSAPIADNLEKQLGDLTSLLNGAGLPQTELGAGRDLFGTYGANAFKELASQGQRALGYDQSAIREGELSNRYAQQNLIQGLDDQLQQYYNQQTQITRAENPQVLSRLDQLRQQQQDNKANNALNDFLTSQISGSLSGGGGRGGGPGGGGGGGGGYQGSPNRTGDPNHYDRNHNGTVQDDLPPRGPQGPNYTSSNNPQSTGYPHPIYGLTHQYHQNPSGNYASNANAVNWADLDRGGRRYVKQNIQQSYQNHPDWFNVPGASAHPSRRRLVQSVKNVRQY